MNRTINVLDVLRAIAVIAVLLALAACSTQNPRVQVSAAEAALAASGQVALTYMHLPTAKAAIKEKIKTAYDTAYAVLVAAQSDANAGRPVNTVAINAAIEVLQAVIATIPPEV